MPEVGEQRFGHPRAERHCREAIESAHALVDPKGAPDEHKVLNQPALKCAVPIDKALGDMVHVSVGFWRLVDGEQGRVTACHQAVERSASGRRGGMQLVVAWRLEATAVAEAASNDLEPHR